MPRLMQIPENFEPVFMCPGCGTAYSKAEEARICAGTDEVVTDFKVGDVVAMQLGYTWFDGDEKWVIDKKGYQFHKSDTYRFWFVITAIEPRDKARPFYGDRNAHRVVYHVQTLALKLNGGRPFSGWTHPFTHKGFSHPEGIEPPPEVLEAAKDMIGLTFERLL